MGIAVFVLGFSGSGKSTSMRNFNEDELALVNVNGKALPFRRRFTHTLNSDQYDRITAFIKAQPTKTIVVDDSQYLMANEYMRRAKEKSFDKFNDIAQGFWGLLKLAEALPNDVIVYFFNHLDTDDSSRVKAKTIGKLLDDKITLEGMVTVVLKTVVTDGKYFFATQTDGNDTCKSPMDLFPTYLIPNDLKLVDESLRAYYGLIPEHTCTDCGKVIMPAGQRNIEQIVDGTLRNYGRKLCMGCATGEAKRVKANEAKTVSN